MSSVDCSLSVRITVEKQQMLGVAAIAHVHQIFKYYANKSVASESDARFLGAKASRVT